MKEVKVMENNELEVLESKYKLKFRTPYVFEGNTYEEVDLLAIKDVNAEQMMKAQQIMEKMGYISVLTEMSLPYAIILASVVTDKPIEFYSKLPGPEAIKLKNLVTNFLYGN